jgi:hypothetical protein
MKIKPIDSLKSLAELALSAPDLEPLVVYDCVATIAAKLAEGMVARDGDELASAAEMAMATARAVRAADCCAIDFRDFLHAGGETL